MISKILTLFKDWFGELLLLFIIGFTVKLTIWGMQFADLALQAKVSLVDAAASIGAVAGIPIAMLTLALNKYLDLTKDPS